MSTVSRGLPANPHLAIPKKQARELLKQCKSKLTDALERVRRRHPKYKAAEDETLATRLKLSDAGFYIETFNVEDFEWSSNCCITQIYLVLCRVRI